MESVLFSSKKSTFFLTGPKMKLDILTSKHVYNLNQKLLKDVRITALQDLKMSRKLLMKIWKSI